MLLSVVRLDTARSETWLRSSHPLSAFGPVSGSVPDAVLSVAPDIVKKQKYEEAARLRDDEKRIERDLISAQNEWDEQSKLNRIKVDESHIAEVVSMISGVPVS